MSGNEKKRITIIPIISNFSGKKNIKSEDTQENKTVQDQFKNTVKKKKLNFQCKICERLFITSSLIQKHLMRVHFIIENTNLHYRHILDWSGELKLNDKDEIRFKVSKNLKTYTRKPIVNQDIKEEPEFIVPD